MKSRYLFVLLFSILTFNLSPGQKAPKNLIIKGNVMDANQNPISGAIILVDNNKTDVETDDRGFYKIKVSSKARLISVFTLTNGVSETEIGGKTLINFNLKTSSLTGKPEAVNQTDDEVVNIGYGTRKRNEMTTSVGKIDATKNKYSAYQNIFDLIRGEIPGVQVSGSSIVIQGPSSINLSSQPLFVVDGITVNSISDISPRMVKSIEVLKGASTAIYGTRGSNGVILINLIGAPDKKR
jgi:TonB-dependent SusC/RagA subfamily outer membrane receptor